MGTNAREGRSILDCIASSLRSPRWRLQGIKAAEVPVPRAIGYRAHRPTILAEDRESVDQGRKKWRDRL
jgi:hypothetical protein